MTFIPIEKINTFFEKIASHIIRRRWIAIAFIFSLTALGVIGLTQLRIAISIDSFFLSNDPVMVNKRIFEKTYGNSDFIGVLFEAEDVFTSENLSLIREIGRDLQKNVPYAGNILSLTEFSFPMADGSIKNLKNMPIPQNKARIKMFKKLLSQTHSLHGRLYAKDYSQAWIILRLKKYPSKSQWKEKVEPAMFIGEKAWHIIQKYREQGVKLTPTGVPIQAFRKNFEMNEEMHQVLALAALIAMICIIFMIRSPQGIMGTILVVCCSIIIVFGGLGLLGIVSDTAFMLVPMLLTIAVAIGYTVHISNQFTRQFKKTGKRKESVIFAYKETGWPILFTATTTIAALLSFLIVPIKTIRWVGAVSSVSIITVYLLLMLFYGCILALGKDKDIPSLKENNIKIKSDSHFINFSNFVIKYGIYVSIIFFICIGVLIYGLTKIRVDLNTKAMLGTKLSHVKDQVYVGNSKVGAMYSYDIMFNFHEKDAIEDPEILKKIDILSSEIAKEPLIKRTSSICIMIKEYNKAITWWKANNYTIPNNKQIIRTLLMKYRKTNPEALKNWVSDDNSSLRIFVEVSDNTASIFSKHMKKIEDRINELFPKKDYTKLEHGLVGSLLQFSIMNQYVTKGQIYSLILALFVVSIMMMIVFGSIKLGLVAMIPNITTIIVAGGLMGFMNAPLEFVTMTIAPMVLGLAVDDTIHFISHTKLEYMRSHDYTEALNRTFISIGRALSKTTLILCATFLAFTISRVNNMVNMGIYTIAAISSALLADFFITPTLIRILKPYK